MFHDFQISGMLNPQAWLPCASISIKQQPFNPFFFPEIAPSSLSENIGNYDSKTNPTNMFEPKSKSMFAWCPDSKKSSSIFQEIRDSHSYERQAWKMHGICCCVQIPSMLMGRGFLGFLVSWFLGWCFVGFLVLDLASISLSIHLEVRLHFDLTSMAVRFQSTY